MKASLSTWAKSRHIVYLLVILGLLAVIVRDIHLHNLQAAMNEGYVQGYAQGVFNGKASCPLPRA